MFWVVVPRCCDYFQTEVGFSVGWGEQCWLSDGVVQLVCCLKDTCCLPTDSCNLISGVFVVQRLHLAICQKKSPTARTCVGKAPYENIT
jgi:hypothetical protein